jgi:hypothetical protein
MTENGKQELVKRAEAAVSGMALREPDWEGLANRIEGATAAAPPEDAALFDAPLPLTADDDVAPTTAAADDSVPGSQAREAAPPAAAAGDDAGPTLSIAPASTDDLDEGWSDEPKAETHEERVEDLTAVAVKEDSAPLAAVAALEPPEAREPVSLADLARASVARRGSAEKASIAKESLALASQSRAQGVEIAQRVHAVAAAPQASPTSVAPPPPGARGGDVLRGPWIGVVIAGIGLAAGFALYLRGQTNNAAPVAVVEPTAVEPAAPPAAAPLPAAPAAKPPAPATPEPAPSPVAALEPTSLPALPHESAAHGEAKSGGGAAKQLAPTAAPAVPGKVAAEKIVLEEEKPAPKPAASATTGAPRPGDAKLRPAELSSNEMTDRPSAGAAQAAVGAVLGAARACVAGHPQPSSAQLVFGSDGQVQSVTVAGPAAGTPAAACIETALKKARVQPFAASTFSLAVTVRPP